MSDDNDLKWTEVGPEWLFTDGTGRILGAVAKHQNGRVWSAVASFRGEAPMALGNYLTLDQARVAVRREVEDRIDSGKVW